MLKDMHGLAARVVRMVVNFGRCATLHRLQSLSRDRLLPTTGCPPRSRPSVAGTVSDWGLLEPVDLLGATGVLPPRAGRQCLEYCASVNG
jgi:hypothetical protein